MLVLTRDTNEGITIEIPEGVPAGTRIHLLVLHCRPYKVRLGIDAPREIRVHRDEILETTPIERV